VDVAASVLDLFYPGEAEQLNTKLEDMTTKVMESVEENPEMLEETMRRCDKMLAYLTKNET